MATNEPGGRFTSQWVANAIHDAAGHAKIGAAASGLRPPVPTALTPISDALAQVLTQIQGEHTEFVAQREQVRNLRVRFCTEVLRRLDEDAPTGANERG